MQIAVIVIPTYNEAEIIGQTIDYLATKTFPAIKNFEMKILVVDGNSPDGTGEVVKKKAKYYPNIFLYTETSKDGLGAAYLKGFKYAMEELNADFVFEFDSDLQHPPEMIPLMLAEVENGYDYVIGSRKVKGGASPREWGFKRLFFSEAGGLTARLILFFPFKDFWRVTDPTTGLKVTRVKGFLDRLNLDFSHLYTKGFAYKMQLLFETLKLGARYKEVPLKFQPRTTGESKIEGGGNAIFDGIRVCLLTRFYDDFTQKFLKFALVGGFGFLINLFGLKFFNGVYKRFPWEIGVINFFANATASEISIISNFTFNNIWTFAQEKITSIGELFNKFVAFNVSSIFGGIIVPSFIIGLGTQIFGDQYRTLFLFLGVFGFTIPYNWFIYNKVIWRSRP